MIRSKASETVIAKREALMIGESVKIVSTIPAVKMVSNYSIVIDKPKSKPL